MESVCDIALKSCPTRRNELTWIFCIDILFPSVVGSTFNEIIFTWEVVEAEISGAWVGGSKVIIIF